MRGATVVLLGLVGCGRLAFDELPDTAQVNPWGPPQQWTLPKRGDDPALTGDLLELYFNVSSVDIYSTSRATSVDAWATPAIVSELDSTDSQSTPEPSLDGLTLYFGSTRTGSLGGTDIWMSTRAARTEAWGVPMLVPELCSTESEHPGNTTADGLTTVLDSRRGGKSDDDLFIAQRASTTSAWETPTELVTLNVSGSNDESPDLSADGLELYFDSNRTGTNRLYVAYRSSVDEGFGPPEPLDYLDTGNAAQYDPWISGDGHTLVFYSGAQIWHSVR